MPNFRFLQFTDIGTLVIAHCTCFTLARHRSLTSKSNESILFLASMCFIHHHPCQSSLQQGDCPDNRDVESCSKQKEKLLCLAHEHVWLQSVQSFLPYRTSVLGGLRHFMCSDDGANCFARSYQIKISHLEAGAIAFFGSLLNRMCRERTFTRAIAFARTQRFYFLTRIRHKRACGGHSSYWKFATWQKITPTAL